MADIDKCCGGNVQCNCKSDSECPPSKSTAGGTVLYMMEQVKRSGKCGTLVLRWDGSAWSMHKCEPPVRVNSE